jgi:hypothetical protein
MSRSLRLIGVVIVHFLAATSAGLGQVTFLPPTPYLSAADSPFDMSGLGTTFFLEDFEDGDFDWPAGMTTTRYVVNDPSPLTDSVDGDDGIIDGSGTAGYSLKPDSIYVNFSNPPGWINGIDIFFDETQLGFLPNVFGFVWTDGMRDSFISLHFDDGNNVRHGIVYRPPFMDESYAGETAEDRFIGFTSDAGIKRVDITNGVYIVQYVDQFEIDHLQFGLMVPEPGFGVVPCAGLFALLGRSRLSRFDVRKGVFTDVTQPPIT